LNVHQIFSSIVNNKYWSVLIFYNDELIEKIQNPDNSADGFEENSKAKSAAGKTAKTEDAPTDPIVLTADEEKIYAVLRGWRNEHSSRDGLPPLYDCSQRFTDVDGEKQPADTRRFNSNKRFRRKKSAQIRR
jgi:hypothetical protein